MEKEVISDCLYKDVCTNDCSQVCIRYSEMKFLLDSSDIPTKRRCLVSLYPSDCDYDAFCELADFKNTVYNKVQWGQNLYIGSRWTGNGKTSWAIKILIKYFDAVWAGNGFRIRGLFVHVPTFLNKVKNFNDPMLQLYKDTILQTDLVVWDDIASTQLSTYDNGQLLSLIDQRILEEKSNIYTGNIIDFKGLEKAVGTRLASRIMNNSKVVILNGKDRRSS